MGVIEGAIARGQSALLPGSIYHVDSVNGSDSNSGTSWSSPKLTITAAVAVAVAGDVILIKGSFTEAVTVAVANKGISIIGAGTGTEWQSGRQRLMPFA